MPEVLKADCSAGDAYLEKDPDLAATSPTHFYVQFDFLVPAATLAAIVAAGSPNYFTATVLEADIDGLYFFSTDGTNWQYGTDRSPGFAGTLTTDVWHTVVFEFIRSAPDTWTVAVYLDGASLFAYAIPWGDARVWSLVLFAGGYASVGASGEIYYVDNVRVGTSLNGTQIFADSFSSGDASLWDGAGAGAPTIEDFSGPEPTFAGPVRVGVAFDDVALEPDPTWVYLTDGSSRVASYSIDRGRQFEFDKTDAGTAVVSVNDRDGTLDPTNTAGPYFGLIEPLLQVQIELWNPVALEYQTRFRGWIEDYDYTVEGFTHQDADDNTVGLTRLQINCVDIFEILTAIEMQPDGTFGDTVPAQSTGNIFFDNIDGQGRVDQVMGNAGIPTDYYVVFTLNIDMLESVYSPSENVLQVIQDVADAEFPTVANVYTDRFGRMAIHGRLAKFDPATVAAGASPGAWDFTHWKAGDGKAVAASPSDTAHIRAFAYNRGLSMIRNSALCTPTGIADADIPGQYVSDPTSIGQYGIRSWSAENLFVEDGTLTGNDGNDECLAFANFIIANYASPRNRITDIEFKSVHPDAPGAAANWDMLCRADISDLVDVTIRGLGDTDTGYIFNAEPFFIEGVHEEATPATGEYAMVTLSLDLSPQAYFTTGAGVT